MGEALPPRTVAVSGRRVDRRVVVKASAAFAAMAAVGSVPVVRQVRAQDAPETLAATWVEGENVDAFAASAEGAQVFEADFPFYAVAPHWSGETDFYAQVEISFSDDGATWTDPIVVAETVEDAGQPDRDGRHFAPLVFMGGASFVRYQGFDGDGNAAVIPGLAFTYIDASAGPNVDDVYNAALEATVEQPPIISRAQWGANEAYRFENGEEIWPPEYQTVEHVIIHHTATSNFQDPLVAIRSIYYYHAVTRGWGDIGYNYLVDWMGNVYEGRVGGENVIGGHAFQYARGSSGIGTLGDFSNQAETPEAEAGLVWITAWVGRALDPLGSADFHETPNLPTICAHRDVNSTECPGDFLYADLGEIRQQVAAVLGGADPEPDPEFEVGDEVEVVVADGNLRTDPGLGNSVIAQMALGTILTITDGPTTNGGYTWYEVDGPYGSGWCASILIELSNPVPPPPPPGGAFEIGDVVEVTTDVLNLRSSPSLSGSVLGQMPNGTQGTVTDGPETANGYTWWQLDTSYGTGWSVEVYLGLVEGPSPPPPPSGAFEIGDVVEVATDILNLRSSPSLNGSVIGRMPLGTQGTVVGGPTDASGYTWWQLDTSFGTGWSAELYLELADNPPSPPPPPSGGFEVGDEVTVDTDILNLRSSPSLSGSVVARMPQGTELTITAAPVSSGGYTWYGVSSSQFGDGFCAGEYLSPLFSGSGIEIGDTVQVIDGRLNMRSGPGLSASVVDVLPDATQLTVTDGPTDADGYTWWQVENTTYGSGWCAGLYLQEV
jgi:uncharacterized protein YgiM (DUF1202 family)